MSNSLDLTTNLQERQGLRNTLINIMKTYSEKSRCKKLHKTNRLVSSPNKGERKIRGEGEIEGEREGEKGGRGCTTE